ncbi:MAG TPA: DnaA/Hda family protein [Phycisphaerales bacterium]|nr:DnaA/Hda family protein [Phycisphaerales bacterium]
MTPRTQPDIAARLADRIGKGSYRMWFDNAAVALQDGGLTVTTSSRFEADWIARRFQADLDSIAAEVGQGPARIEHTPEDPLSHVSNTAPCKEIVQPSPPSRRRSGPRRFHRLDDLVVGPSNRLAWTAANAIVDDGQAHHLSPLFIFGSCGVGKTHLLQGICEQFRRSHPGESMRYLTGEEFTNEYIQAVRHNQLERFRRSMRRLHLLAIDDVHFVQGKTRTQDEILHTLDAIQLKGARLVLASDAHPSDIRRFNASLASRFTSGMLTRIESPDESLRREVVRRIASSRGFELDTHTIDGIVDQCADNIRQIQGLMARVSAMRTAQQTSGPVSRAEVTWAAHCTEESHRPIMVDAIVDATCQHLAVDLQTVRDRGRSAIVVLARGVISLLARELTAASYPEIATALGRRTHSTVHAAQRRLQRAVHDGGTCMIRGQEVEVERLLDQVRSALTGRSHGSEM